MKLPDFKIFCNAITEFGFYVKNHVLFARKLKEYGKLIIKHDVIETCLKYFK